jgi:hypothetical protein
MIGLNTFVHQASAKSFPKKSQIQLSWQQATCAARNICIIVGTAKAILAL